MQWCFVSEMKLRYCVLFRKWSRSIVFCFGNEAAVLCFVSETCGPGSCGCSPPLRIIPAQKFLQIRMHSSFKKHPYSEKFVVRDYFPETNASLFGRIRRQGLFSRGECIPIRKISPPGIIFPRRMHPYSKEFAARDYFPEANASLSGRIRRQGLFSRGECIPIRKNSPPRIIVPWKMHPWRAISLNQDAFRLQNASLTGYFIKSGCTPPLRIIPAQIFLQIRMHSSGK